MRPTDREPSGPPPIGGPWSAHRLMRHSRLGRSDAPGIITRHNTALHEPSIAHIHLEVAAVPLVGVGQRPELASCHYGTTMKLCPPTGTMVSKAWGALSEYPKRRPARPENRRPYGPRRRLQRIRQRRHLGRPGAVRPETSDARDRRPAVHGLLHTFGVGHARGNGGRHAHNLCRIPGDGKAPGGEGAEWPPTPPVEQTTARTPGWRRPDTEIGAAGFEPATSCSQSRRATELRHAPPTGMNYCALPAEAVVGARGCGPGAASRFPTTTTRPHCPVHPEDVHV